MDFTGSAALRSTAIGHVLLAIGCCVLLFSKASPLLGVHPALKPFKFAVSIAIFLGTISLFLPLLNVSDWIKSTIALALVATMILEIIPITLQAARGTTSHFNFSGTFNITLWLTMMGAIVVMTLVMLALAVLASTHSLQAVDGKPLEPEMRLAWRAGLWVFSLAAVSGFAMGSRLAHSVAGNDGGAGIPFLNWSSHHGDLRVSHFFAMHGLQVFPISAWLIGKSGLTTVQGLATMTSVIVAYTVLTVFTLIQAFFGKPFLAS